jgi:hypothetical protein
MFVISSTLLVGIAFTVASRFRHVDLSNQSGGRCRHVQWMHNEYLGWRKMKEKNGDKVYAQVGVSTRVVR